MPGTYFLIFMDSLSERLDLAAPRDFLSTLILLLGVRIPYRCQVDAQAPQPHRHATVMLTVALVLAVF